MRTSIKPLLTRVKPYLRWVILGGTLFFIAKTLKDHWQDVTSLQLAPQASYLLPIAFGLTLAAHVWSGWVWHWILALFHQPHLHQPLTGFWSTPIYLKTNVAKYLPGNVWHFFGRVRALQRTGTPTGIAVLAVVMEPLLMAVAALIWASLCGGQLLANQFTNQFKGQLSGMPSLTIQLVMLCGALVIVHPRIFNPILQRLGQAKAKAQKLSWDDGKGAHPEQNLSAGSSSTLLHAYPLRSLLGEMGFVGLRSLGFIAIVATLHTVTPNQLLTLIAAFSLAWLLGLVIPGAPGGIGVFEATALPLLSGEFPVAVVLSSVAIYRLVSVLAEVSGAIAVWLVERMSSQPQKR
ncbi:MAG: lysylphosphatidylglycerol synthase domain-containing protein [Cyanobacteria bacterium J06621_11]